MVGTGLAIAMGIGALAGQTASNIYGTKSANKTNRQAQTLQSEADTRAAAIETARNTAEAKATADALAQRKSEYDTKVATDQQHWQDYLKANEPQWQAAGGVLQSLYGLAGMRGGAPAMPMPSGSAPPPGNLSALAMTGQGGGAPSAPFAPVRPGTRPMAPVVPVPTSRPLGLADLMRLTQAGGAPQQFDVPTMVGANA